MASSQSSCVVDELQIEAPTCWCGLKAPLKTSHTKKNPGRKFYACPKYNTGEEMCQFFIWADILQLVEEKIRTRENAARKREDDLLLREYEVQKTKDKLVERENVLYKQEKKIGKQLVENRCARICLCIYWVLSIVIIFGCLGL
ncbi:hypothetical protein F2P56_018578 [Juglans regia]|uniref:GRF-type domain-containing protein n=1 Tax=Juglans regia TaxID=51240 RepID=A0A833UGP3_JUGRE|nr:hypothetical protein F2P56_018578 [Juglans regia]